MNGLTHFFGIIMAIVVLLALLTRSAPHSSVWHIVSFSIFGSAMILLYTFSTLYHWLPVSSAKLSIFRKIDHIMIFIFIAASYTPICFISLRGAWGWSISGSIWFFTIAGIVIKLFWMDAPRVLYTAIYVIMGWIVVIAIWPLSQQLSLDGLFWLALGGAFYTTGALIYALKKPNPWPNMFGFHEIFHIFILFGSFSHFWLFYHYV